MSSPLTLARLFEEDYAQRQEALARLEQAIAGEERTARLLLLQLLFLSREYAGRSTAQTLGCSDEGYYSSPAYGYSFAG